jgi:hypothetical protein
MKQPGTATSAGTIPARATVPITSGKVMRVAR